MIRLLLHGDKHIVIGREWVIIGRNGFLNLVDHCTKLSHFWNNRMIQVLCLFHIIRILLPLNHLFLQIMIAGIKGI